MQLCSDDEEVEFHYFSFYRICFYTTPAVSCHCPAHSTCPMRKLLLMPTQQKKRNLYFNKAAHNRHSWERVKQTCHPSDKDCDSLILEEGRQCPNGSKWRGCSSSENTEQKTGYSSPLGDLLGRLCGIRLLFIGIFTHCRNCSVSCYLARH